MSRSLDLNLIESFEEATGGKGYGPRPFIAAYQRGDQTLAVVVSDHSIGVQSPVGLALSKLFNSFQLSKMLLEGLPHELGTSPDWYLRHALTQSSEKIGEGSLAAKLAVEQRASFQGMEPGTQKELDFMIEAGYRPEDVIFAYTFMSAQQSLGHNGVVDDKQVVRDLQAYIHQYKFGQDLSLDEFGRWVGYHYSGMGLAEAVARVQLSPTNHTGAGFVSRFLYDINRIRDPYMMTVMAEEFDKPGQGNVGAIYGSGHYASQEKALKHWLREPTIINI